MSSNDPRIEMHRWYAIIYFGDEVLGVIAYSEDADGLVLYDSIEEWEEQA